MKSGFIAIVGPPNVGKSTFLNQVLEFKLAITSDKPQTTRHRLLGVYNRPGLQAVFLDTPGLHTAQNALNKRMMQTTEAALEDVDALIFMADVTRQNMEYARKTVKAAAKAAKPAMLVMNKIDLLPQKDALFPLLEEAASWDDWKAVVPISALKGEGAELVIKEIAGLLPQGDPLFPDDVLTDLPLRFLCAELIREKVFQHTGQEVPYSSAVTIDEYLEPGEEGRPTAVSATIHVERSGQKAIIIGKKGSMIKKIGTLARKDMETLIGGPVFLDLFVRVEPKWSRQEQGLNKMGY